MLTFCFKNNLLKKVDILYCCVMLNVTDESGLDLEVRVPSVMIASFQADRSGPTVQTQIRLLLIRVYTVCNCRQFAIPSVSIGLITL